MSSNPEEEARREVERQQHQQGAGIGDVFDAAGTVMDLGIAAVEIAASSAGQAAISAAGMAVDGTVAVARVSLDIVGGVIGGLTDL